MIPRVEVALELPIYLFTVQNRKSKAYCDFDLALVQSYLEKRFHKDNFADANDMQLDSCTSLPQRSAMSLQLCGEAETVSFARHL